MALVDVQIEDVQQLNHEVQTATDIHHNGICKKQLRWPSFNLQN